MKWALAQLFRYNGKPFSFDGEYDFSDYIQNDSDILAISITKVSGTGRCIQDDHYEFNIHIETVMTLECAVTLEPVDYKINLDVIEEFDKVESSEDVNIIKGNTIDLKDVVWQDIYLEKPMRIVNAEYEATQKN